MQLNKGAMILIVAKLCNCFAHFGIRSIFVLYMIGSIEFTNSKAFGISAVLFSIMEFGSLAGGYLGDKCIGLKKTLLCGSIFLTIGFYLLLYKTLFYLSLLSIALGGSLYGSNIPALLGLQFEEDDIARKKAFTYLYMAQNLGGLLGVLICSLLYSYASSQAAFFAAFLFMVIATFCLLFGKRYIVSSEGKITQQKLYKAIAICCSIILITIVLFINEELTISLFSYLALLIFIICCKVLYKTIQFERFFLYLMAVMVFFAASDQIFSSLLVYAKTNVHRSFFGVEIPPSFFVIINPLVIILLGSFFAKKSMNLFFPFLCIAGAYAAISISSVFVEKTPLVLMISAISIISLGELFIGPKVFAYASKIGKQQHSGMIMAMVSASFALAYQFSGKLSKMVAIQTNPMFSFGLICLIMLTFGLIFFYIEKIAIQRESV